MRLKIHAKIASVIYAMPVLGIVFLNVFALVLAMVIFRGYGSTATDKLAGLGNKNNEATAARLVTNPFIYSFNADGILNEQGDEDDSTSPYFWVTSGAELIIKDGIGATVHGNLPTLHRYRLLYSANYPLLTHNGYHPQNVFRMVTRSDWKDVVVETDVRIDATNQSNTVNQNPWYGVFLMSRYIDQNTLYYAGIRMDGKAIVKKKYKGIYYTLGHATVFPGDYGAENLTLLPHNEWIGMRSQTRNSKDGRVQIVLSLKREDGLWKEVLRVTDRASVGSDVITSAGKVGIRGDYMDLSFRNFRIENVE